MKKMKLERIFLYIGLILFALVLVFPFIWLLSSSFKESKDIFSASFELFPKKEDGSYYFTLENYKQAFEYLDFALLFKNTLFVAVVNTVLNLYLNGMAGYAFARMHFKGRDVIFKVILTAMMVPGTVLLVPNMIIVNKLGFYDSLGALILPFFISIYNIFMMRQHFFGFAEGVRRSSHYGWCRLV
ncbi:carbohydrate ABC transporter permease [Mesobacillus subterraneus]|uniref:carbohydrate ABC transporter permease n=1 Tax=Mesobacillus subterraneus TaxID=285983 RepID=UPI00273E3228|nr:carbohydrate ABC transporter permease [Mesobacillus subterraneus]WLR54812.1 carbohydrate ABC transporter permease [Mesobacillus subterraneus]